MKIRGKSLSKEDQLKLIKESVYNIHNVDRTKENILLAIKINPLIVQTIKTNLIIAGLSKKLLDLHKKLEEQIDALLESEK